MSISDRDIPWKKTGKFSLRVYWGHNYMTNQKASYKYCSSVSSDQKCHPVRSLYVSKTLLIIQGSSSSQNYESQHLGIYHSHMNHWKFFNSFPTVTEWVKRKVQCMLITYGSHFWNDQYRPLPAVAQVVVLRKTALAQWVCTIPPFTPFLSFSDRIIFSAWLILKEKEKRKRVVGEGKDGLRDSKN